MNELTIIAQQVAKGLDLKIDGASLVETHLLYTAARQYAEFLNKLTN